MFSPMKRSFGLFLFLFSLVFLILASGCGSTGGDDSIALIEQESARLEGMDIYFGSLNGHSNAEGAGGADSYGAAFVSARNSLMDFYAITDDSDSISQDEWNSLGETAASYTEKGSFVAMRGFCWNDPYYGHASVLGTDGFITYAGSGMDSLDVFYDWIGSNGALVQFDHPGDESGVFNDLAGNETALSGVFSIETGNNGKTNSSAEYYPYYVEALDNGFKIAPSASQEEVSPKENPQRTAVIAEELSAAGLLDAMRMRRIYSTDDMNTRIIFKSGDEWMGSTLSPSSGTAELTLLVSDDEPIIRLEIITNKGKTAAIKELYTLDGQLDSTGIEYVKYLGKEWVSWKVSVSASDGSYYFARVTGENTLDSGADEQVSITAPIWFGDVPLSSPVVKTLSAMEEEMLEGKTIYFGNIHGHSNVSDGENPPETDFILARYSLMDFYVITDHDAMTSETEWETNGEVADLYNKDGSFVAMRGFEWSHPVTGHMCIYNTSDYTSFLLTGLLNINDIYKWIDKRGALAQFNHPGRESGIFGDLALYPDAVDNFFAIETGNKDIGNNDLEYFPYYITALDKGWKVAPTSNLDNHAPTANSHRTAMIADELTRNGLLEAMKARRIYSTDDPDIRLILKCGETFMGSTTAASSGETRELALLISDNEPVTRIEIITNGGALAADKYVFDSQGNFNPAGIEYAEYMDRIWILYKVDVSAPAGSYYFARVTSKNTLDDDGDVQMAVTAPIWFE